MSSIYSSCYHWCHTWSVKVWNLTSIQLSCKTNIIWEAIWKHGFLLWHLVIPCVYVTFNYTNTVRQLPPLPWTVVIRQALTYQALVSNWSLLGSDRPMGSLAWTWWFRKFGCFFLIKIFHISTKDKITNVAVDDITYSQCFIVRILKKWWILLYASLIELTFLDDTVRSTFGGGFSQCLGTLCHSCQEMTFFVPAFTC